MKSRFLSFTALLLLTFCLEGLYAQQIVLSAGGEATGSAGSVSYSVGQIAFMNMAATEGTITEGVHQPYELFFNGLYDEPGTSLECMTYPNPATTFIILKIENHEIKNMSYRLCNITGLFLKESVITEKETTISMDELLAGIYLLTVSENDIEVNFFKIIKK